MASLQQEPTGIFHIVVRIEGRRYKRSLSTKMEAKAHSRREEIEETLNLISRGKIEVPGDSTAIDFVLNDGKNPTSLSTENFSSKAPVTLKAIFERFFAAIPSGNIEDGTLKMLHIHKRHLLRHLKPNFDIAALTGESLQSYVNKRTIEKSHLLVDRSSDKPTRKVVSATTIRKEITTLGAVWRWGKTVPLVISDFPNQGLRFPKTDEKAPFQTWAEIERQINAGQLNACAADSLWECLYLRKEEIIALLAHVKQSARHCFLFPMFAMAAYTGARRSEMLRSQRIDFDFDQNVVTIREMKRIKGCHSTRRVPLTGELRKIMLNWFETAHPGGLTTFAKRKKKAVNPISSSQAQSHLRETLQNSRWNIMKGWHCLRHSFISNLACAGVDQRIIDDFVGHSTEDMRRRYRHLFPDVKQTAIESVFG